MPLVLQAGMWGLVAGLALVVGAAVAWFLEVPPRVIAAIMAFGSGVLISALSFELMDEAYKTGGFYSPSIGFLGGAALYTLPNIYFTQKGGKNPKPPRADERSQQPSESGKGLPLAGGGPAGGNPQSVVV